jgi:hypothetical protein
VISETSSVNGCMLATMSVMHLLLIYGQCTTSSPVPHLNVADHHQPAAASTSLANTNLAAPVAAVAAHIAPYLPTHIHNMPGLQLQMESEAQLSRKAVQGG